jgi:hypothetical protein
MSCSSLLTEAEEAYSPYADTSPPMNVYWGDTHLHTTLSQDSGTTLFTDKGLSPEDAYRFALGETITTFNGTKLRRQRPLDFLVIADHAENIGLNLGITQDDKKLLASEVGQKLVRAYRQAKESNDKEIFNNIFYKRYSNAFGSEKNIGGQEFSVSVWNKITSLADQYNDVDNFTAFIGYEWTSWGATPDVKAQLHRVVIFKDAAKRTQQFLPFSALDSSQPEDLWDYLSRYEHETGGDAIIIPHNGNLSNGRMFALSDSKGQPLSPSYAAQRNRWEPLFEVTQIKGDSETHPFLSPNDEFADYETFRPFSEIKPLNHLRQYEYARSGLKLGLGQQSKLGVNPFKFGMIGSTDAHGSLSAVAENNFNGKASFMEPSKERLAGYYMKGGEKYRSIPNWQLNAAGYAAVWAQENSRASIFAAMKRKEVYASTGPRITLRFFGGWNYETDDAHRPNFAHTGYTKGVPMGGDLTGSDGLKNKAPSFLIRAIKDPDGANLDRIQVVKGWHDSAGELHEKVYDVQVANDHQSSGKSAANPLGHTVDIQNATYTNTIGKAEFSAVWKDPDFNKDDLAFYYLRVLEIPTPRWPAYDAKVFKLQDLPKEIPMITQERAYSSPIWYTP